VDRSSLPSINWDRCFQNWLVNSLSLFKTMGLGAPYSLTILFKNNWATPYATKGCWRWGGVRNNYTLRICSPLLIYSHHSLLITIFLKLSFPFFILLFELWSQIWYEWLFRSLCRVTYLEKRLVHVYKNINIEEFSHKKQGVFDDVIN
jgi:hypothetical protein